MINNGIYTQVMAITALLACGTAYAAASGELTIGTTKAGATVTVDRIINGGKALVSVDDASKQPLLGLGVQDFTVSQGSMKGKVLSVQPGAETQDVPLGIVMVLDNSYSMYERNAIASLLASADKVLKVVRPIDQVHMVVLVNDLTTKVANRDLHVKTFKSSNAEELREFVRKAYSQQGLTASTELYEGMLAGLDIISKLPATAPRIMVVFSDGEELNSHFKNEEVDKAAQGAGRFNAYAIDYMPDTSTNKFLTEFVTRNHGQIWKAESGEKLVSILGSLARTLDHSYILAYAFPPPNAPQPIVMVFDEVALFDVDKAELKPAGKEQIKAYREEAKEQLSRADKIRISGHTDNTGSADYNMKLSQRRAEAVRDYLKSIGVESNKMEAIGEGMSRPVADNRTKEGRAKNRRVEVEVFGIER